MLSAPRVPVRTEFQPSTASSPPTRRNLGPSNYRVISEIRWACRSSDRAFRYMLGPGVCRLAAGGKRIRTPGPTCGCGSLWANGTERCRRIRQWTPMDSSGTKPSASAPGRADRRERTSPMPEPKPRRWGQRSGAVRGLGRAGRDPRQPGSSKCSGPETATVRVAPIPSPLCPNARQIRAHSHGPAFLSWTSRVARRFERDSSMGAQ
jgi:hypothetical protein